MRGMVVSHVEPIGPPTLGANLETIARLAPMTGGQDNMMEQGAWHLAPTWHLAPSEFIESEMTRLETIALPPDTRGRDSEALNRLFRTALEAVW